MAAAPGGSLAQTGVVDEQLAEILRERYRRSEILSLQERLKEIERRNGPLGFRGVLFHAWAQLVMPQTPSRQRKGRVSGAAPSAKGASSLHDEFRISTPEEAERNAANEEGIDVTASLFQNGCELHEEIRAHLPNARGDHVVEQIKAMGRECGRLASVEAELRRKLSAAEKREKNCQAAPQQLLPPPVTGGRSGLCSCCCGMILCLFLQLLTIGALFHVGGPWAVMQCSAPAASTWNGARVDDDAASVVDGGFPWVETARRSLCNVLAPREDTALLVQIRSALPGLAAVQDAFGDRDTETAIDNGAEALQTLRRERDQMRQILESLWADITNSTRHGSSTVCWRIT
eukprot:TRINITY_DN34462_c0_g1_i1.p1 TRINITY_DN34462_c0_g1~~TRINITY_DN34462_c0_g1_i1.p1  ORF type:complete len:346 (-),score=36.87 TRINITY_DN34462_c0_g1_i1:47-1084(-)